MFNDEVMVRPALLALLIVVAGNPASWLSRRYRVNAGVGLMSIMINAQAELPYPSGWLKSQDH